jgi:hypothetical protein
MGLPPGRAALPPYLRVAACLIPAVCIVTAAAQEAAPAAALTAAAQKEVIETLGQQLEARYVFADVAARVAASMADKLSSGAYAGSNTGDTFAKVLTRDLREAGNDRHFLVVYDPRFQPEPSDQAVPTKEQLDNERAIVVRAGFGIARVEWLPGNVGYLDIRQFVPADFAAAAYGSAMTLLSGTEALILDLRQNGGGDPAAVAALVSYFFPEGDDRHLNDLYWRADNRTQEFWTVPVQGPRYAGPVYVLTSAATFSGGEECAYDLQTQKRATLIGHVTGGGANPGDALPIGHGFVAFIPSGRAINPITKTNWEHVGVKPDVDVPPAEAMKDAYVMALKALITKAKDPGESDKLKSVLARVEKGEEDKPSFMPPPQ